MKQILLKKGNALVEDVHSPSLGSNEILIRVMSSCLSVGTELQSLKEGKKSLFKRVFENPDKVLRALEIVGKNGINGGIRKVKGKLNEYKATGYSASGIIIETGNNIKGFDVGDKVACAGGGYAYHSELITVPQNLVVKMPNNVSFEEASSVALGAISLQGVRRLSPSLGECIAVVGLGFIGQITSQLLIQNGCRVVAIDIDKSRLDVAKANGVWNF